MFLDDFLRLFTLHSHLATNESKIDSIKNSPCDRFLVPMRTKFRGDRPNGIEVDVLQRHLAVRESKMDSIITFAGKNFPCAKFRGDRSNDFRV